MKRLFTFFAFISFTFTVSAQVETLMHDNIEREYRLYVPQSYTGDQPVPLILNFHGFGSNSFEQSIYGNFSLISNTEGFIVVHPEGTLFMDSIPHWNVGGFTLGSQTDDVGFTEALIDKLSTEYNINQDRIYATGMSNGGYMSFNLACFLTDRIAAVASVTGAMSPQAIQSCNPDRPVPVMQIHGTNDDVVPYEGAAWSIGVADVIDFWVEHNETTTEPELIVFEDTNTLDGSTAEHFIYENATTGVTVEHIKVTGGGHTWPGTAISFPGTNYDFNASELIWEFFSRYDKNGLITTNTEEIIANDKIAVFPNPSQSYIWVNSANSDIINFEIVNLLGQTVLDGLLDGSNTQINIENLNPNIYFLKVDQQVVKFIKQ